MSERDWVPDPVWPPIRACGARPLAFPPTPRSSDLRRQGSRSRADEARALSRQGSKDSNGTPLLRSASNLDDGFNQVCVTDRLRLEIRTALGNLMQEQHAPNANSEKRETVNRDRLKFARKIWDEEMRVAECLNHVLLESALKSKEVDARSVSVPQTYSTGAYCEDSNKEETKRVSGQKKEQRFGSR